MKRALMGILLFLVQGVVLAEQGCAPGFFPGGTQPGGPTCIPIPGYGTTNNTSSGGPVWADRWGAIAIGGEVAGVAEGLPSRSKAKRVALADCKAAGGEDCKIVVAYFNQCAALASGPGNTSSGRAPSIERAATLALEGCSAKASGTCEVIYSGCSMAEQIR